MEAIPTFEFLKSQIETGYFEQLIRDYLLENPHGAIVIIRPEKGRTARMDRELAEKLQAYKESLSEEEIEKLVQDTKDLEAYQEENLRRKIWRRFRCLEEKIFPGNRACL